jgi:hypothetical protein
MSTQEGGFDLVFSASWSMVPSRLATPWRRKVSFHSLKSVTCYCSWLLWRPWASRIASICSFGFNQYSHSSIHSLPFLKSFHTFNPYNHPFNIIHNPASITVEERKFFTIVLYLTLSPCLLILALGWFEFIFWLSSGLFFLVDSMMALHNWVCTVFYRFWELGFPH